MTATKTKPAKEAKAARVTKAPKAAKTHPIIPFTALPTGRLVHLAPGEYSLGTQTRVVEAPDAPEVIRQLAISIYENGQKVPVSASEVDDGLPAIDAGFHREAAVRMIREGFDLPAGPDGFPRSIHNPDLRLLVLVTPPMSEFQRFVTGIIENLHEKVSDVQEARAHEVLREKFKKGEQEIADIYGYTNDNRVRKLRNLLECNAEVIAAVHDGSLSLQAALTTHGAKPKVVAEVVAKAAAGERVTARDVADTRDRVNEEAAPSKPGHKVAATTTDTDPIVPRNASALKKFIDENILSSEDKDSFPDHVLHLATAIKIFLAGEKGPKALLNAWNAIK